MEPTLTEERNPVTSNIDTLPTLDMLALINSEDQKVALVVRDELANIAAAVDWHGEGSGRPAYVPHGVRRVSTCILHRTCAAFRAALRGKGLWM